MTYKYLKQDEAAFYYKQKGTDFWILLKGRATAWIPIETHVIEKLLEQMLTMCNEFIDTRGLKKDKPF